MGPLMNPCSYRVTVRSPILQTQRDGTAIFLVGRLAQELTAMLADRSSPRRCFYRYILFIPSFTVALSLPHRWISSLSIDYQAANEFIEAHYGNRAGKQGDCYFKIPEKSDIYNARIGYFDDIQGKLVTPSLDLCGFDLLSTNIVLENYRDLSIVRQNFLPELERLAHEAYPDDSIDEAIFWNPVVREANLTQTRPNNVVDTPTSHFVSTAHIDKDFGAYDSPEKLVDVFLKNHMHGPDFEFPAAKIIQAIQSGRRFAICNFWRNIGTKPVGRAPLAFLTPRYSEPLLAFPDCAPDLIFTRWYCYPEMTPNEVLCFCQYDRDVLQPSDMWHCALMDVGDPSESRASFDVRCLVLFSENAPKERDRFSDCRTKVQLTEEESGMFCNAQSRRRKERVAASD